MRSRINTFSLLIFLLAPTLIAQALVRPQKADSYRVLFVNQRTELPPWSLAMFAECRAEFERLSGRPVGMLLKNVETLGAGEGREQFNEPRIDFMICRNDLTEPPVYLAAQTGIPLVVPACDTALIRNPSELPPHVYIATIRISPARTAKEVRTLCPGTQKLIVIAGAHETDHFLMERAKEELGSRYQGMAVEYWEGVPLSELKTRLAVLPGDHAILFLKMTSDPNGTIYVSRNVVRDVVHYSPVPVFGIADTFVEEGILGGYVLSSRIAGKRGGEMLARLAASEPLPAITHVEAYGEYQFNWNELRRWGIRESRLPAGARMLNRPDSLFERHPWIIWLTVSLTGLLTLIIGTTLLILRNRQQTLAELRNKEQWLKLSTETAGIAIWEYDVAENRMARSENHDELYGLEWQAVWTVEQFRGAVHPDDRDRAMRTINQSITVGGPDRYSFDYRILWPDKSEHWLALVGEIYERDAEGTATRMRGCTIDITDRKQTEDALRASEERYCRAQAVGHVGSWEYNVQTARFLASDETKRIFGFDPAEPDFSTDEVEKCIPEKERVHQALVDLIETNKPYNLEYEARPRNGAEPRMITSLAELKRDEHGAPQKVVGVIQDITGRKQVEEALQKSEARARLMADLLMNSNQPVAVGFHDGRLGRLNPAFCELIGYTEEELQAIDWSTRLTPPEWLPAERKVLAELERTGKPVRYEKEYLHKNGTRIPIELFVHLARDADGNSDYYYAFITDITERKQAKEKVLQLLAEATESRCTLLSVVKDQQRAEEEVRKLNEELEQRVIARTEQLEAANKELEAFSYSVSHDLRAPLRAVDGYTRMLSEDYGAVLDEEGKRICSVISSSAQGMGRLIDDLLAFSRFGRAAINPSVIDMTGMARAIFFELATPEKRERVEFILQPLPEVAGDPTLMRQVWVNLLSNALKFSENRDHPAIEVSAVQQGDEVIYCVRDNGAGFDMRYVNKLFGVFQRLHTIREFAGTGVGLAIVQRIVVRHGGRVWAKGEVDHGASFYFALKGGAEHGL